MNRHEVFVKQLQHLKYLSETRSKYIHY